jgi:dTMP kinase
MGTLIAIEGIDGSGKGTQTARLVAALRAGGRRVESLPFPRYAATTFGQAIGDFLNGRFGDLNSVHPQLAAVLYAGDRFESRELLRRLLAENDVVVLDRYVGSNLAHQGAKLDGTARTRLIEWIEKVEFEVFGLPRPALTVLIDMSSAAGQQLVKRKPVRDYTDQKADLQEADAGYLDRVRQCYRELAATRADWSIVCGLTADGRIRSIEDVGSDVHQAVLAAL